ncbi:type II toxin-antitoxin system ParD family antitoxin [Pseudomonas sp. CFBP 5750]
MGSVRKTITVANQRAQERNAELKDIRSALEDGESSGPPRPFNPDAFKERMLLGRG